MVKTKKMIKTKKAKLRVEHLYCHNCGTEMVYTGTVLPMCPPLFSHKCPKCGVKSARKSIYPRVIIVEKNTISMLKTEVIIRDE